MRATAIGILFAMFVANHAPATPVPNSDSVNSCERFVEELPQRGPPATAEDPARMLMAAMASCPPEVIDALYPAFKNMIRFLEDHPDSRNVRFDLLDAMYRYGWKTPSGAIRRDWWLELSLLYLEHGDVSTAREVLEPLNDGDTLLRIRIDRRFEGVVPTPSKADIVSAFQQEVDRQRRRVEADPRSANARSIFAQTLVNFGKPAEALPIAEGALAQGPGAFDDPDNFPWLHYQRASALGALGKFANSLRAYRDAVSAMAQRRYDVSHTLNLGCALEQSAQPDEALTVLADAHGHSEYGGMVLNQCLLGAHLQKGETDAANAAFQQMEKHRSASWDVYSESLLRQGLIDQAAASVIERLRDPDQRNEALHMLQHYQQVPPWPAAVAQHANFVKLLERADVRRVALQFGRIEKFDFPKP